MISKQDQLRYRVKIIKAQGAINSYKELAEDYLETNYNGFLNWLNGQYDYGQDKYNHLCNIVNDLILPID